jgi:hypothetical protein
MEMTRRKFVVNAVGASILARLAMAGGVGFAGLELSGCNLLTDIENWAPIGEDAINSIISLLTANGVPLPAGITVIVDLIEAGFNALVAAAKEYQSTVPPPQGALQKIQDAFQAISDQFASFVTQLSPIAGKILAIVVSVVKVVISTIGGFISKLPSSASLLAKVTVNPSVSAAPVYRSIRAFKKAFNAQMDAAGYAGFNCPPSCYLKVSLFEHFPG